MNAELRVERLACVSLTVGQAAPLIDFYERALGFRVVGAMRLGGELCESLMGVRHGARVTTLGLGREVIEMVEFDEPGWPYPAGASASDLIFQHLAIVVSDMTRAYERLLALGGWTPISVGGPRRLPPASGGVGAFKFRDPEGHPLELLAFPPDRTPPRWANVREAGPCLGIDHTAISVGSTEASLAFYEALGLKRTGASLNHGPEQDRLDGLENTEVQVTALAPDGSGDGVGPHLELLCYARRGDRPPPRPADNDIAATRLVFEAPPGAALAQDGSRPRSISDPDGHRMIIRPGAEA